MSVFLNILSKSEGDGRVEDAFNNCNIEQKLCLNCLDAHFVDFT